MKPSDNFAHGALETELRSLALLPPDPDLMARLERKMNAPAPGNIISMPAAPRGKENHVALKPWLAVAACAVVATGAVTWKQRQLSQEHNVITETLPTGISPASQFVPQGTNNQFQRVNTSGLIVDPERGPMRKVRFEFNTSQQFIDPADGTRLEVSYPSHQEILVIEPVQ